MAANRTWDGGGANANWDTVNNWDNNALPANGETIVFATAFTSGTSISLNGNRTINDLSITTTTDFSLNNNILTITTGNITRSAASGTTTINSGVVLGANGAWNITGTLVGAGVIDDGASSFSLTKSGAGKLILNAANTFDGGTTVSAGTVSLGNASALGTGGLSMSGGILDMHAFSISVANLSGTGGSIEITGNSSTGTLTVGSDNTSTTFAGVLTESGNPQTHLSLTKTGTGTLTLSGANTYSGDTTISGGVLRLNSANSLPGGIGSSGGTSFLSLNGGVVGLGNGDFSRGVASSGVTKVGWIAGASGGFAAYTGDRNVNLGGALATMTWNTTAGFLTTGTLILGASDADKTVTFQNPIAFNGAVRTVQVNDGSAATDAILSGVLSGTGSSGMTKTGNGTLVLSGINSFAGVLTVQAGTVSIATINSASATGVLGNSANSVVLGSSATTGTLEYSGSTASSTKKFTMGTSGTGAFQVDSSGTTLTLSGVIDGSGALKKTGAGTLTLSGANTYTGGTTLSQGAITLGSTQAGAASALGGSASAFNFAGGILNANDKSASVGALSLTANSTLNLSAAGTAGTLTFASATWTAGVLTINNWTGVPNTSSLSDLARGVR